MSIVLFSSGNPAVLSVEPDSNVVSAPFLVQVSNGSTQDVIVFCQPVANSINGVAPAVAAYPVWTIVPTVGPTIPPSLVWPPDCTKVYFGFGWGYPFTAAGASQLFSEYPPPTGDEWFAAINPPNRPIAALYKLGCITAALSDQTDPNPPHNVHPMVSISGAWAASNPLITILNDADESVIMYVRQFDSNNQDSTYADSSYPVPGQICTYSVPSAPKLWYGFAFAGNYATPADYFTDHPYDGPGGMHHTGGIDQ